MVGSFAPRTEANSAFGFANDLTAEGRAERFQPVRTTSREDNGACSRMENRYGNVQKRREHCVEAAPKPKYAQER